MTRNTSSAASATRAAPSTPNDQRRVEGERLFDQCSCSASSPRSRRRGRPSQLGHHDVSRLQPTPGDSGDTLVSANRPPARRQTSPCRYSSSFRQTTAAVEPDHQPLSYPIIRASPVCDRSAAALRGISATCGFQSPVLDGGRLIGSTERRNEERPAPRSAWEHHGSSEAEVRFNWSQDRPN
jgi:hypothetical protein